MATTCYTMVRGSSIRVTRLDNRGEVSDPITHAVATAVASVEINESTESSSNEMIRNDEDDRRLIFIRPEQMIRHTVDINFLRVDPGVLNLVAGVPVVLDAFGDVVGFDSGSRYPASSFALEVWSKLTGQVCADGQRRWGYTLFPFLKGGYLTGFTFENGLVTFSLQNAQSRRGSRWSVGPYDLTGTFKRLDSEVSRNTSFRTFVTTTPPPEQTDGVVETTDVIDGGTASVTSADIIDGQFVLTSPDIISGGFA